MYDRETLEELKRYYHMAEIGLIEIILLFYLRVIVVVSVLN
jgi:hypothetical protein